MFNRQSTLGATSPSTWIKRKLTAHDLSLANQNLASLAKKYGVDWQIIVQKNGVKLSNASINAWVLGVGGRCLPRKAGQPLVGGGCPGWAVFRPGNEILLPSEAVIKDPSETFPIKIPNVGVQEAGIDGVWWLVGLTAATAALLLGRKKKNKSKKTSPAPVIF